MPEADLTGIELGPKLSDRRITADYVADALREYIQSGQLADGAVLNQAAIAAHFGVSRVPVREAMRQLQAEGLIESQAHRLAAVRGIDADRLIEIYDLRALLEGFVVERAVPNIDAGVLKSLRALEKQMRGEQDHSRWLDLNAEFHRLLLTPSGAAESLELIEHLRSRAERYVRLWSQGSGLHRPAETGREHAEIIKLVAAGDAAGARAAVEQHIAHTRDRLAARASELGKSSQDGSEVASGL